MSIRVCDVIINNNSKGPGVANNKSKNNNSRNNIFIFIIIIIIGIGIIYFHNAGTIYLVEVPPNAGTTADITEQV